jgi:hypothetical protein
MASSIRHGFQIDFDDLAAQFEERGYGLTPALLNESECNSLIKLYDVATAFRTRVVMARHNFGRGEYKYFADPVPEVVRQLRERLYVPLTQLANRWAERLKLDERFPPTLDAFLEFCSLRKQTLPTPLMLRYEEGDYNCLHQDLYGEVAFPLQAACVLSQHGRDYEGGEFLLTEQRPRMQTRGEAVTLERGRFIIFPNRWRPVAGKRGDYRVNVRHGVSRLKSGQRYCLGIIFHNAK